MQCRWKVMVVVLGEDVKPENRLKLCMRRVEG